MACNGPPVQPEIESCKRREHAAHAKIQPACMQKTAHASINHWIACLSLFEGSDSLLFSAPTQKRWITKHVCVAISEVFPGLTYTPVFHPAAHLKILDSRSSPFHPDKISF
mmetsp:Transcript_138503/g.244668  ORF Transcript_138503/g.244668 Transcript_138503/m.244668 type:complete len:111 (-) Transcript_138503:31-363(-)